MKTISVKSLLLIFTIILAEGNEDFCPSKCKCKTATQRDQSVYIKLRCGDDEKVKDLEEIDLLNLASEIVHLNLSNNLLSTFYLKVQLIALQKLDLSKNLLIELEDYQFSEIPNLRRLDLSGNSIKTIKPLAFAKLHNLERLKLNQNQITSIALGTFDSLPSLKQLDISANPLKCDCSLLWLLDWAQKGSIKLVTNPTCSTPSSFKGTPLRKLKVGVDIHCKSPALINGLPLIEMLPNVNQVVFEGDTLKLECSGPNLSDADIDSPLSSKIEWTWLDAEPKSRFSDVSIESSFLQSTGFIASTLRISKLKRNHTGIWNCLLISKLGNHSKGIAIVVISNDTQYCPITVTSTNKGTYMWPRTVVNNTVTIPCEAVNLNYDVSVQKASYFCSNDSQWAQLNTSMCSFTSETTKILEQFSKVNSSIMESAKHFRNYTSNLKHFTDVMDIVFAVETIENYLTYLTINQIGGVLMDVTNNLLGLPKNYFKKADELYGSCAKLVNITERIASIGSTNLLQKSNIATEIFTVKRIGFSGLKCTWYVNIGKIADRLFYCITSSQGDTTELHGKITEASITVPETLFRQLSENQGYVLTEKSYNLLISMHATNKLFPVEEPKIDITTSVVGTKLINMTVTNLTDPVFVMLRTPPELSSVNSFFTPVWWNTQLNNGTGGWSSEGCHFSHEYHDHIVFYCYNFGYYGLMQDVSHLIKVAPSAKFKLSHPAIYVGSFMLFMSLTIAVFTYLMYYPLVQMPKKAKHSLINLWIAICCLCFLYVFGIYQTENVQLCQIVGMLLHYFTLSSLLWMCVGVNCMYKRLSKNDIMQLQDDELPSDQPIKKPILGIYFVGWGIAIIVCGISAAINIKEYASASYCFLRLGPPLSALYIPFIIFLIFLGVFFLLIRCVIYNLDANGHLSEGTQATENVDLDLLEPNFSNNDTRSVLSVSSKTASSEVEDPEHSPSAQLKAYIIFLFIYVLTWCCGALATAEPYYYLPFEDNLFSVVYAIFAAVLSAFTLFFYGVARSDIRGQWFLLLQGLKRNRTCFRSRNVSDTIQNVSQIQILPLPIPPVSNPLVGELTVGSRSSSRSSSRTKSNSHAASNILKAAADLNGSFSEPHGAKINNVNLLVLHRQQYRTSVIPNIIENPTSAAEVFYNPHQSTVARKFFKRQKRHLMKRNNLVPHQRDSDSTSVMSDFKRAKNTPIYDRNIFGTNSKVNNTNIHVELVHKKQQKNPNIFSDSAEDDSISNFALQNIVLTAERSRKKDVAKNRSRKKQNVAHPLENNMRSVSQQCTLEYSSENISDSILDKISPDKSSLPSQNILDEVTDEKSIYTMSDSHQSKVEEPDVRLGKSQDEAELLYNPSEISFSIVDSRDSELEETVSRIYVNPSHDLHHLQKRVQSRASSVSVSDLDELYQQIRRGPKLPNQSRHGVNPYSTLVRNSPCFSDSDINSYMTDHDQIQKRSFTSNSNLSDNVETTV